jgi:G3E family GTPase
MNENPKMFFVGGFLGAGKTTAIHALAKLFAEKGLRAAAITNDQAVGLVDTSFLAGAGIPAEEVAGSCFCCNFEGLSSAIHHIISRAAPNVILAEPVGSCTDIVATVIRPMRSLLKDKVEVQAYSVLVEPDRWDEISQPDTPWSIKYLFDKQIQEADFIIITKLDTLSTERRAKLMEEVTALCPESRVIGISAREGVGLEEWSESVQSTPPQERWLKEIDYQRYADAEAEMGWLNGELSLTLSSPHDGMMISWWMGQSLAQGVANRNGRIGHLKLLTVGKSGSAKIGVTQIGERPVAEGAFTSPVSSLNLTINIRATLSPGDLSAIVTEMVAQLKKTYEADVDVSAINAFRPGAPKPTYRYTD